MFKERARTIIKRLVELHPKETAVIEGGSNE
jgi:hypothetical protein